MTIEATINFLQDINAEVSGMIYAPELAKYPSSLDTMQIPIAMTTLEEGLFKGINDDNQSEDQYKIQVLFAALGQGSFGPKKLQGVNLFDAFRTKLLDPATYAVNGQPVLSLGPYRITLIPSFTSSGLTVVEWPKGTERFWDGFEIMFTVKENWLRTECEE